MNSFSILRALTVPALASLLFACGSSAPSPVSPTPPTVIIVSPADNTTVTDTSVTFSGTATDAAGLSSVEYSVNGSAKLTATGTSSWSFTAGGLLAGNNTIRVIAHSLSSLEGTGQINVVYAPKVTQYTLNVQTGGGGKVVSSPAGIDCGSVCTTSLNSGTSVTLTATPESGFAFAGWGGDCSGSALTCTLNMTASRKVSTAFTPVLATPAAPVVTIGSPGNASVVSEPSVTVSGTALDSVGLTSVQYSLNGGTRLNASGTATWSFTAAGLMVGNNILQVFARNAANLEGSSQINVTYTPATPIPTQFTLAVQTIGGGKVTSSPAGIDCGSACSTTLNSGSTVTLVAAPDTGSTFTGWAGACSGTNISCTLTMTASRNVTAAFITTQTTPSAPTVSIVTPTSGTVVSQPSVLVSGTAADGVGVSSVQYSVNGAPRVDATGLTNWSFTASGLISGNNVIQVFARNAAKLEASSQINVVYTPPAPAQFALNVQTSGQGTVTSSPAGIDCGSACSVSLNSGSTVTLTAIPASGSVFTTWGGACSGNAPTCTLSMTASRSVTAAFAPVTVPPVVTISSPVAGQTVSSPTLTVSGTVNGIVTGLRYLDVSGTSHALTAANSFAFTVTLNPGANTIRVLATNGSDPEVSTPVSVTYTPPAPACLGFTLTPSYPVNAGAFIIAQRADALYKVKITNRNACAVQAQNFDSATLTGSVIGGGANQVQAIFRKDLSSGDDLAFVLVGGASAPVGTYNVSVSATTGTATAAVPASVQVTECSLGCQ